MDEGVVMSALKTLADIKHTRETAASSVPNAPGLYAFYGDDAAWSDLGLSPDFDGQPLYVGKAERSLKSRDVETHFAAGRTGSSTLRRSLAALLVTKLGLVAIPRSTARPERTANFGLDDDSERRLSSWMDQRMTLSTWTRSEGVILGDIETSVLSHLRPPLNLTKVGEPRTRLRMLRQGMADATRTRTADACPTHPVGDLVPPQGRALVGDEPFSKNLGLILAIANP